MESEEYSALLETKMKHARKLIENVQPTPGPLPHEPSHSHTLMTDTPPFVISSYIHQYENQHLQFNVPHQNTHPIISSKFSRSSNDSHSLPKLTLPKFCGHILERQAFWDSFESAVHLSISLTNVQKFNYSKHNSKRSFSVNLRFCAHERKLRRDYKLLKDRFGNNEKVVSTYLEALIEIP